MNMKASKFKNVKTTSTALHKVLNIIGLSFWLVAVVLLLFNWSKLPETVPIHFNFKGEADGWGSKYSLIILPTLTITFYSFLSVFEKKPQYFNFAVKLTEQNIQKQFQMAHDMMNAVKNFSTVLLSFIVMSTVFDARETPIPYTNVILVAFIALLVTMTVIYLIRSIKNR